MTSYLNCGRAQSSPAFFYGGEGGEGSMEAKAKPSRTVALRKAMEAIGTIEAIETIEAIPRK